MEPIFWRWSDDQLHDVESPTMPTEPAWTTARCNRLLRPLSSKIALLRKSNGTRRNSGDEEESESQAEPCHVSGDQKSNTKNGKRGVLTPHSLLKIHGLSWDPSPRPRKRVKLTYASREIAHSTRGKLTSIHAIQSEPGSGPLAWVAPSFVNVDRPLLPSNIPQQCDSRPTSTDGHEKKFSQPGLHGVNARSREIFRRYAKSDYPECWKLFEGIHSGLETLLKATSKNLTGNKNGARSLFSMCLRKVPQHIALQEHWCRAQDPEGAADVSSSIYGELETVGARTLQGSNALQEVVRAHGVDLVGSAVLDGLICFPVASRLVKLCLHLEAYDEGQHIVECILRHKSFSQPTSRNDVLFRKELSILDQFAIITGRFGFLYRKLTELFESKLLPIGWISSPDMIQQWSGVISCISEGNSDAKDAGNLLRTVILMSEGFPFTSVASHIHGLRIHPRNIPSDASEGCSQGDQLDGTGSLRRHMKGTLDRIEGETPKTGLRLLAALCALDFAQDLATGPNATYNSVLQDLAVEAHQIIETQNFSAQCAKRLEFDVDGPCLVLLAAGLSSSLAKTDETALQRCLRIFECTQLSNRFPSKAASFLSVVASWRGQALASDGFEFMQEIVQQLLRVSSSGCCRAETRTLVGSIAITAAIQYASITGKPRHLSWALDTETCINSMNVGSACQTPRRATKGCATKVRLGFRWEEGICEWVSGTSGVPKPKPIIFRDFNDIISDPEDSSKSEPTGALGSSLSRARCFREGSSSSKRSNSELHRSRIDAGPMRKTCGGKFFRVEIDPCSQASNIQAPQRDRQQKIEKLFKSSAEAKADDLSKPESMQDQPLGQPEKQTQITCKSKGLIPRLSKRRTAQRGLGKSQFYTGNGGHTAHTGPVKHVMEAVDSEDELSFR